MKLQDRQFLKFKAANLWLFLSIIVQWIVAVPIRSLIDEEVLDTVLLYIFICVPVATLHLLSLITFGILYLHRYQIQKKKTVEDFCW